MTSFYRDPAVRQRLIEFLGGERLENATAGYLTHPDGFLFARDKLHPVHDLDWFLDRDLDIARSLADSGSLLLHLDVEYVNFDAPAEALLDPWRTFDLQEPVVAAIEELLLKWGIQPLHLITGQGHHFVWRISRGSALAQRLEDLCPAPELLENAAHRVPPLLCSFISHGSQRAFSTIGLIMEFLAHQVKAAAAPLVRFPVEITAVHVGPHRTSQREIISIDTSEYGDPLHTRMVRMPFTNYLKPWVTGLARSLGIEQQVPRVRAIPLHEIDIRQALKVRQVEEDVRELARRACVRIPEQGEGTTRLLDAYLASPLRRFHEFFYSSRHDPREIWPDTYDRTPPETFPFCARHVAEWPNDLLLKPAGMQLVARCLLAAGWHPRHIAGFIRSKFENPKFQWGVDWSDYDPGTRADFYTRLFAGLYATGLDRLIDLNCTSTREKGFCFAPEPGVCHLEAVRNTLLSQLPI